MCPLSRLSPSKLPNFQAAACYLDHRYRGYNTITLQYIAKMRTPGCEKNLRCRTTTTDVHTQEPVMPLRLLTRPSQSLPRLQSWLPQ